MSCETFAVISRSACSTAASRFHCQPRDPQQPDAVLISQRSERRVGVSTQSWHRGAVLGRERTICVPPQKGKGPPRRGDRNCEMLICSLLRDTATTAPRRTAHTTAFAFIALLSRPGVAAPVRSAESTAGSRSSLLWARERTHEAEKSYQESALP